MALSGPIIWAEGEGKIVVFVHGLRGDAVKTWSKGKKHLLAPGFSEE
jgi:hypothetical protein